MSEGETQEPASPNQRIQAVINALTRQRDNAQNEVVNLSGELAEVYARLQAAEGRIAELEAELQDDGSGE